MNGILLALIIDDIEIQVALFFKLLRTNTTTGYF